MPGTIIRISFPLIIAAFTIGTLILHALGQSLSPAGARQSAWQLVWADEFIGPAGYLPDPSKWAFDIGATGWGNHELEEYTRSPKNVALDGHGNLSIRVLREESGKYTSARLKTAGLFEVLEGRIEARIKIPRGQGLWPAFWMMGSDLNRGTGWPACGEIDVMENIGKEPKTTHGTVHGPGYSGANGIGSRADSNNGKALADDFHIYGVQWSKDAIEFYLDGKAYGRVTPASLPSGSRWVYDHAFFLIMNVAVGGDWPGNPDASTRFPQEMLVDWVRVWRIAH